VRLTDIEFGAWTAGRSTAVQVMRRRGPWLLAGKNTTTARIAANIVVDMMYSILDPRVKVA
jgi:ABC-type dipeptide/oligopeptide/nickel transport system permease component